MTLAARTESARMSKKQCSFWFSSERRMGEVSARQTDGQAGTLADRQAIKQALMEGWRKGRHRLEVRREDG